MTSLDIKVPENGSVVDVEGLVLESDSVTVLFGPNGAGKTTILRRLAGIIGGDPLLGCSYQPQSPYLFRGLAGYNLGLGLDAEEASRGGTLAGSLGIRDLLMEPSHTLSGGETQRLAIARTLARRAGWVLLDEPLSAIDTADRSMVLKLLANELHGRSSVVVTHDLDVAVALADQIAVIDHGRLLQQGPVSSVLRAPVSVEVARIFGLGNIVEGEGQAADGLTTVTAGTLVVVGTGSVDGPARAIIPGDSVVLSRPGQPETSERNRWTGRVVEIRKTASVLEVTADVGFPLVSVVTSGAADDLGLEVGVEVMASVKATAVVIVPA